MNFPIWRMFFRFLFFVTFWSPHRMSFVPQKLTSGNENNIQWFSLDPGTVLSNFIQKNGSVWDSSWHKGGNTLSQIFEKLWKTHGIVKKNWLNIIFIARGQFLRDERHSVRGSKCYKEKKSEKHASDREIHETDLFQCNFDLFNGMPGHVTALSSVGNWMTFNLVFYSMKNLQRFRRYRILKISWVFQTQLHTSPLCGNFIRIAMICSTRFTCDTITSAKMVEIGRNFTYVILNSMPGA